MKENRGSWQAWAQCRGGWREGLWCPIAPHGALQPLMALLLLIEFESFLLRCFFNASYTKLPQILVSPFFLIPWRTTNTLQGKTEGSWSLGEGICHLPVWSACSQYRDILVQGGNQTPAEQEIQHRRRGHISPAHSPGCHCRWWCCLYLWDERREQDHCRIVCPR